jgi:Ca2+/H+ antiporter, TMEM165/GDT1 family
MDAFLISTAVVALAEIGDKTQLLALVLSARFRKPVPIILGLATATLLNHTLAALVGAWVAAAVGPDRMRLILGIGFIAMAVWTLIPDRFQSESATPSRFGVYGTTVIAFFLMEMGDKTQIATAALAAKYGTLGPVVAGTSLGMLMADVPAVLAGKLAADRIPLRVVRVIAAAIFALLGAVLLLRFG